MVERMSIRMKEKFNKYWSDVCDLMVVALINPRYKIHLNVIFVKIHVLKVQLRRLLAKWRISLYNLVSTHQDSMEDDATPVGAQHKPTIVLVFKWEIKFGLTFLLITCWVNYLWSPDTCGHSWTCTWKEPLLPRTQDLYIIRWRQHACLGHKICI